MTSARRRADHGFVMVPVMVLLVVALGLGLAVLAIVDTQTSQGSSQRMSDAAQTLAEGVVAATANSLATNGTSADWPTTGACQTITGDLTTAPTGAATSLAYRVTTEVQARFAGTSSDYSSGARATTWKVSVCPVAGTGNGTSWTQTAESRWTDSYLTRTITSQPAGTAPTQLSLWVRGQASVRGSSAATPALSRAVASKIQQSSTTFVPPVDYAVGTGSFSTDLSTGLNSTLLGNSALVGGLLGQVLGTQPLIKDTSSKIGVRCGLLQGLNNGSLCLTGALSSVAQTTASLGLANLNSLLGVDRTVTLGTWTMAPTDAVAGYKALAQASGVYKATVPGTGDVTTHTPGDNTHECFTDTTTAQTVVYLSQIGDGNQYCTVSGTHVAKILIVEKGGVRITGPFTGVVYALNKAECTAADGTCSASDRTAATNGNKTREVVRVEGNSGKVTGSVWADGASGSVGIYPSFTPTTSDLITKIGDSSGICGVASMGTVLNTLGSALNGVGALLGAIVGVKQVRYPGGVSTQPDKCTLLKAALALKTPDQLEALYQGGGTVAVTISEHRTCSALIVLGACAGTWSGWSSDATDQTSVTIPPLLGGTTSSNSLLGQLSSLLGTTLGNTYTAIQYDVSTVTNASVQLSTGAGPVVGTYRNIGSN